MWYAFEKGGTDMKNIPMFTTENGVAAIVDLEGTAVGDGVRVRFA